jgi:hypothetical protein
MEGEMNRKEMKLIVVENDATENGIVLTPAEKALLKRMTLKQLKFASQLMYRACDHGFARGQREPVRRTA